MWTAKLRKYKNDDVKTLNQATISNVSRASNKHALARLITPISSIYFMHSVKHCNAEFTTGLFKEKHVHRSSAFFANSTKGHRKTTREEA